MLDRQFAEVLRRTAPRIRVLRFRFSDAIAARGDRRGPGWMRSCAAILCWLVKLAFFSVVATAHPTFKSKAADVNASLHELGNTTRDTAISEALKSAPSAWSDLGSSPRPLPLYNATDSVPPSKASQDVLSALFSQVAKRAMTSPGPAQIDSSDSALSPQPVRYLMNESSSPLPQLRLTAAEMKSRTQEPPPPQNLAMSLPWLDVSTNLSDVSFWLFTRDNPDQPSRIPFHHDQENDPTSSNDWTALFDTDLPTKFLAHGWNSEFGKFSKKFRKEYLVDGGCSYNLIAVEWSKLAGWEWYPAAAENSIRVGNYAGDFVSMLIIDHGLDVRTTHAVGHSLGAHVAGHMGRRLQQLGHGKLARITALDPAKVRMGGGGRRVQKEDAEFVDVIHTCSASEMKGGVSFWEPIGHIDFYPEGGQFQKGCYYSPKCSHVRVEEYFTESINSDIGFYGTFCGSWQEFEAGACDQQPAVIMGEHTWSSPGAGFYFLHTADTSPWAIGEGAAQPASDAAAAACHNFISCLIWGNGESSPKRSRLRAADADRFGPPKWDCRRKNSAAATTFYIAVGLSVSAAVTTLVLVGVYWHRILRGNMRREYQRI